MSNLNQKIEALKGKKLLVIGDLGLDEYVNGEVDRISPEAPVPVLEVKTQERCLGLSCNVAQNIVSLGGDVCFVSVIGDDETGEEVCKLLKEEGVSTDALVKDSSRPTTRKLRVMTDHHHIVRVDYEEKSLLSDEIYKRLIEKVQLNIDSCDGVIIEDYAKGLLSESLIQKIMSLAKERGLPVFVDPHKNTPLSFYQGTTVFTPNFDESVTMTGTSKDFLERKGDLIDELGEKIHTVLKNENTVLTRGKEGMTIFSHTNKSVERSDIPTSARQVFDVTGAGDTVIACLALAYVAGMNLVEACQVANAAAGIVVAKIGCVPCSYNELKKELESTNK